MTEERLRGSSGALGGDRARGRVRRLSRDPLRSLRIPHSVAARKRPSRRSTAYGLRRETTVTRVRRAWSVTAVVVRAGAALWWLGARGGTIGLLPGGLTGRRIGVWRAPCRPRGRGGGGVRQARAAHRAHRLGGPRREARRAPGPGRHRTELAARGHHAGGWPSRIARPSGSAFAVPAAGGMAVAGAGAGLWLKAAWLGRCERNDDALLWLRVDWLGTRAGAPVGLSRSRRAGGPGPSRATPRRWGAAPLSPRTAGLLRPPVRPRSSSADGAPSPGWRVGCPAPGRGRGRCRRP